MKHIIVIETVDYPAGKFIAPDLQSVLCRAVEIGVEEAHGSCFVNARFNVDSAIAAVHEMYNAPKWEPAKQSS